MGIFGNTDTNQSGKQTGTSTGSSLATLMGQNSPYWKAQPMLNTLLSKGQGLFNQNLLDPYVGLSGQTKQGLTGLQQSALRGRAPLASALNTFSSFAKGGNAVGSGNQQNIYNEALGPSYSEGNLSGVAAGDYLNRPDENFERILGSASEKAETAARMAAGAKGRYGGDYAQTEVGRTVGDLQADARYKQYQDERSRQVEANSLMDQMRQAGLGLGLNAANSKTAIESDNKNRMLSGAAGVPGAFQSTLDPYRELLKVGQIKETDQLNKKSTRANNLGALAKLLGIAQPYGTTKNITTGTQTGTETGSTTGTTQGPDNTVGEIAGLGLGGASLLKLLKGAGGLSGLFNGLF